MFFICTGVSPGGQNYTNSYTVDISIHTNDTDLTYMRLSQDSSFEGAVWKPIEAKMSFTLAVDGLQYVLGQFQDAAGNLGGESKGDDQRFASTEPG